VTHQHQGYLGKEAGPLNDLNGLELLQVHLMSILRRLVPDYPFEEKALVLFPLISKTDE
jgi:hypothetical protein